MTVAEQMAALRGAEVTGLERGFTDPQRWNAKPCTGCKLPASRLADVVRIRTKPWVAGRDVETGELLPYSNGEIHVVCQTPGCGRVRVLRRIRGVLKPEIVCNAKCMASYGPNCECSCGGRNHGASYSGGGGAVGPEARGLRLGHDLKVDWARVKFTPAQLASGAQHELEHTRSIVSAARIALDHLRERPDYYERLEACMSRKANRGSISAAKERWLVFSNGKEKSEFWPWGDNLQVELPKFEWPRQWQWLGTAREIRYTSDKIMPDENPSGDVIPYQHDFRRVDPFVVVFAPADVDAEFGEPCLLREIERRSMKKGAPRFPKELAFLAKLDGLTIVPPRAYVECSLKKCYEATADNQVLCVSPEGDMLVALDGDEGFRVKLVIVGPTLKTEESGIDD